MATEGEAGNTNAGVQLKSAADSFDRAIEYYRQFGQKMKEGDAPAARPLREEGRISQTRGLDMYYRGLCSQSHRLESHYQALAVQAKVEGNDAQANNLFMVAGTCNLAIESFEKASEARKQNQPNVASVWEKAANYFLQSAEVRAEGNAAQANKLLYVAANVRMQ